MVRTTQAAIIAAGLLLAGDAAAQSSDWTRSGGELFVQAAMEDADDVSLSPESLTTAEALTPATQPYQAAVAASAARYGLDPKLLHALVVVESAYRPEACSPAGACGLTQLMPDTAVELGIVNRLDPVASLNGGADYLARQLRKFQDLKLALAAYNAGPARVERLGRVPSIPETQGYVVSVVNCYLALTAGRSVRHASDCRPRGEPS